MYSTSFFNNDFVKYEDLNFHISDIGLQRGYAIFDFFKVKNGKIRWGPDYFDRFYNSAGLADLDMPVDRTQLSSIIDELVEKNDSPTSYIKLLLTGGYSVNGFEYDKSNFAILNMEYEAVDPEQYQQGVNLVSAYYQRPNPEIKTTNYFMSTSLHQKRRQYNAIDVLYYLDGIVTETSRANFFIIRDEEIYTTEDDVLQGVTRKNFFDKIEKHYMVNTQNVWLDDVWDADGAFITSTTKGVLPVVQIDGNKIGNGKVSEQMQDIMNIFNPLL